MKPILFNTDMGRECVHFRHTTNADLIRGMRDDELAEFLIDLSNDGNLRIREWLQQPAEEDGYLNTLTTIDAVPVVRCRECKHHNKPSCPMRLSFNWTEDDDFCSYGELKEGAENA